MKRIKKRDNDRINEKNIDFEHLCDFKMIFSKIYNLFSLLNKLKFSKNLKRVNDFDF